MLHAEQRAHGDVLRVAVRWNETRLKGPMLSVAKWLEHAAVHYASARFVAKMDDDAYVHAPRLEELLRATLRSSPRPDRIYLGAVSWFNWFPAIFERSGFGWGYTMASRNGAYCKNVTLAEARCGGHGCGTCVGPFPFASGYLAVLSTSLAGEVARSAALAEDVRRLAAAQAFVTRTGEPQTKVMEDVWLGSLLHRGQLAASRAAAPISYVAISEANDGFLVSDEWGLRATRSAMVVHIRGKQLERFLAVHDFMVRSHCAVPLELHCSAGCDAFLTSRERRLAADNSEWGRHWHAKLNTSGFCAPLDGEAQLCRLRRPATAEPLHGSRGEGEQQPLELPQCCRHMACVRPTNLMKRAYSTANMRRAAELINESKRFGVEPTA